MNILYVYFLCGAIKPGNKVYNHVGCRLYICSHVPVSCVLLQAAEEEDQDAPCTILCHPILNQTDGTPAQDVEEVIQNDQTMNPTEETEEGSNNPDTTVANPDGETGDPGPSASTSVSGRADTSHQSGTDSGATESHAAGDCGTPSRRLQDVPPGSTGPVMATTTQLRQPQVVHKYVVRPAPVPPPPKYFQTALGGNHALDRGIWMYVFAYLSHVDLCRCMRVCKVWCRWCLDPRLWSTINLSRERIRQGHLVGVVRRQPKSLDLSWSNPSRRQLEWLLARLPHVKRINLAGNSWAAINAMCSSSSPLLHVLDLSWVEGLCDPCVQDLFSPPVDHRPGVDDSMSRLHRLQHLDLTGTDISDVAVEVLLRHVKHLQKLNLSYCVRITDQTLANVAAEDACTQRELRQLVLTGCHRLTDACFDDLVRLEGIESVCLDKCGNVTVEGCERFMEQKRHQRFVMTGDKCLEIESLRENTPLW